MAPPRARNPNGAKKDRPFGTLSVAPGCRKKRRPPRAKALAEKVMQFRRRTRKRAARESGRALFGMV